MSWLSLMTIWGLLSHKEKEYGKNVEHKNKEPIPIHETLPDIKTIIKILKKIITIPTIMRNKLTTLFS